MAKIDLTKYERQIDQLVDEAIDCVTTSALGIKGDVEDSQINDYNEVYQQIQDYLTEKWHKAKVEREMKIKLAKVEKEVEESLKVRAQDGIVSFRSTEEATKAEKLLKDKGYETKVYWDRGWENVEYWINWKTGKLNK